jgi:hypothetical protein
MHFELHPSPLLKFPSSQGILITIPSPQYYSHCPLFNLYPFLHTHDLDAELYLKLSVKLQIRQIEIPFEYIADIQPGRIIC